MRILIGIAALIYVLFAVACFRLVWAYSDDRGLSLGEGLFTLLGGLALIAALFAQGRKALIVVAGTVPLVCWFLATPYNSGPPFLIASLIVPVVAGLSVAVRRLS